ncbi:MAG TPA: riboflavin synthase [Candidatus Kryptonia bacterium]
MFTGIVEAMGSIREIRKLSSGARKITIETPFVDLAPGDSLSVNGVCLTVVEKKDENVSLEAVEETIKKTSLGDLKSGDAVNLERAATLNSRLGGHLVQGHVDATGKVIAIRKLPLSWMFQFRIPPRLMKYLIPVGSIAINGVSLTVAEKLKDSFKVAIIPHTFDNTVFKNFRVGSIVNIEIDLIAKYVESLLKK